MEIRVSLPLDKISDLEAKLLAITILNLQKSLVRAEVSLSDEVDANLLNEIAVALDVHNPEAQLEWWTAHRVWHEILAILAESDSDDSIA